MTLREMQIKHLATELKPEVREIVEEAGSANAEVCLIDMCSTALADAKNLLSQLEILSVEPRKINTADFISDRLIKLSGNDRWQRLKELLIEELKDKESKR